LVTVGPWAVVAGGEAQQGGHDTELASVRLFDMRSLAVWSLPLMGQPHDDAVAVGVDRRVIVFGGYLTKGMGFPKIPGMGKPGSGGSGPTWPEISVPVAGAAVEMLVLPPSIDGPPDATHQTRAELKSPSPDVEPNAPNAGGAKRVDSADGVNGVNNVDTLDGVDSVATGANR
jgi:hypothetical protein